MSEVMSVLMVLASLSFLLEVVIDRLKEIFPFIRGEYNWTIKGMKWEVAPVRYVSLVLGIIFMWAIGCPVSLFAALGFTVPAVIDIVSCGVIISGGSDFIFSLMNSYKMKQQAAKENAKEVVEESVDTMDLEAE